MQIEKTVFISYRRTSYYTALTVFQNLKDRGYDVFFDFESIDSGSFEQTILNQIRARAHFIVILHADTLIRTAEQGDWVRREIETAIDEKRNIIPVAFDDFDWGEAAPYLVDKLGLLKGYNALDVPRGYFEEAMEKLSTRFLNKPLDTIIHPTPPADRAEVERKIETAAAAPAPTNNQLTAQQLFSQAYMKETSDDHDGAISDYTEVIRLDPMFAMAYNNRGWAHYRKGDARAAIRDYEEALRLEPNNPLTLVNRSAARTALNDLSGGLADAEAAIRLNPSFPGGYQSRAWVYSQQGQWQAAIYDYTQAIMLNPNDVRDYLNRGWALFNIGNANGAIQDYNAALYLMPNNVMAYNNRGLALQTLGNLYAAMSDFETAIRIDPNVPYPYFNRGNVLFNWGQYDNALMDFERAIAIYPNYGPAYAARGVTWYYKGDSNRALSDLERAISLDPSNMFAREWITRLRSGMR